MIELHMRREGHLNEGLQGLFNPNCNKIICNSLLITLTLKESTENAPKIEHGYPENFRKYTISWLTVSNQTVKSLSLCYEKSSFFKIVQPIDLIFFKMIEIIQQNFFNRADFLFRS